jgi:Saxitoxin biosynthesis operon protein SxtJ
MLMEGGQHHASPRASERSFGMVFGAVFALSALYVWWKGGAVWAVAVLAALSLTVLLLGLYLPRALAAPNRLWAKVGLILGLIITPIVMALIFFAAFTPSGLLMRMSGRDPMRRRREPDAPSYWVKREQQPGTMRQQF